MRATCLIRNTSHYRRDAFVSGLEAAGYYTRCDVVPDRPGPDDVLVIWNRYGGHAEIANTFEYSGGRVVVAENGYFGKSWIGRTWFALSIGHHNGCGIWHAGGQQRWDGLGVDIATPRTGGHEVVVLAQRGIGEPGVASPTGWAENAAGIVNGRIRRHPGNSTGRPLLDDLENASSVVTWSSAAALQAIVHGIPVYYGLQNWIGAGGATHMSLFGRAAPDQCDRLGMLRRLAWAMWTIEEIADGTAFSHLLGSV